MQQVLDAAVLRRWFAAARDALGEARADIDALNVYPVPDADTGTNLYLTMEAAAEAAERAGTDDAVEVLRATAQGALLGARGNSGVILSQLFRGVADGLERSASSPPSSRDLAAALQEAADLAYAAVARPVEGTMLTVARAAADAASAVAGPQTPLFRVVRAAARGAREALERTPDQLDVLARAGVVDAGGRGLVVLLDAFDTTLTGWRPVRRPPPARRPQPAPAPSSGAAEPSPPAYEVMYLLDADPTAAAALRERLDGLGDAVLVVGGDRLWNVHVHVDDVAAAIEAGIEAGRPHRLRVTRFADQQPPGTPPQPRTGRAVVVVSAGAGLSDLYEAAGAVVVPAPAGQRRSTVDLLDVVRAAGHAEVVLLPNDRDLVAVAEAAAARAREDGTRIAVVPTRSQVQGIAALAVHEPGRAFDEDVVAMTAAAGATRHGGVAVAEADAVTSAGQCRKGDALGLVEDDVVVVGEHLPDVARQVVGRMLSAGGELVTLVTGHDDGDRLAAAVVEDLRRTRPDVDTAVHHGGQTDVPLLVGVE